MDTRRNDMKEVLTKHFWQGVKKTFYEALEGPPAGDSASEAPAESNPKASSTIKMRPSQETSRTLSATPRSRGGSLAKR